MTVPNGYSLVFQEDFNNEASFLENWTFEEGMRRNEGNELQAYVTGLGNNVSLVDSELVITGKKETIPHVRYIEGSSTWPFNVETVDYTSGSIILNTAYENAYIEIETLNCTGLNTWPAVWMVKSGDDGYGEIDIVEHFNTAASSLRSKSTIHVGTTSADRRLINSYRYAPLSTSVWTKRAVLLNEKYVEIYINDLRVLQVGRKEAAGDLTPLRQAFQLRINLALGYSGSIPDEALPTEFKCRNLKIYQEA